MQKLKLNYKPRKSPPREHYRYKGIALQDYRAIEYARWLAQRDGIKLPDVGPEVRREYGAAPNAVRFGGVVIAIPNHDWTPTVVMEFES
jgi:hypothetical protein